MSTLTIAFRALVEWLRSTSVASRGGLLLALVFLLPLALRMAHLPFEERPLRWSDADWSSVGHLPPATGDPQARLLVFSGRAGRWKGVFAVHSWIVVKAENATTYTRYDVVGWGAPVRVNGWAPDGRWYGDRPRVVADLRGETAAAAIPRIVAAIKAYPYRHSGDYRLWPGPNSNSFVASVLRAAPELGLSLPPEAVGRDYVDGFVIGRSDRGAGIRVNAWGVAGLQLDLAGLEVSLLGLVAGLDVRDPALMLPGYGRIALSPRTAFAQP